MDRIHKHLPTITATNTYTNKCNDCRDTGWITVTEDGIDRARTCRCYELQQRRALLEKMFRSAKIPARFKNKTLDNFDQTRQPKAHSICRAYVQQFPADGSGLFLVGPWGTGKSHLAYAVLHELVKAGNPGMAATVPDLMDDLRPGQEAEGKITILKNIDFLVLDDLGAQKNTEWVTERIFVIVNARYADLRPTIYTSNSRLEELERTPGWARIIDRIIEACRVVKMDGSSYRKDKRGVE